MEKEESLDWKQDYQMFCKRHLFFDVSSLKLMHRRMTDKAAEFSLEDVSFIINSWDTYGGYFTYCSRLSLEFVSESYQKLEREKRFKVFEVHGKYNVLASDIWVAEEVVVPRQEGLTVVVKHDGVYDVFYKSYDKTIDPHRQEREELLQQGVIGMPVYYGLQPVDLWKVFSVKNVSEQELREKYCFRLN